MTAVRIVESTKYGAKLFAYLLGVAIVGGVFVGLGYSLAWEGLKNVGPLAGTVGNETEVAAGTILGLIGIYVLGTGLFATINKFIVDGISQGIEMSDLEVEAEVGSVEVVADAGEEGAAGAAPETTAAPATPGAPDEPVGEEPASPGETAQEPTVGSEPEEPAATDPAGHGESTTGDEGATEATTASDVVSQAEAAGESPGLETGADESEPEEDAHIGPPPSGGDETESSETTGLESAETEIVEESQEGSPSEVTRGGDREPEPTPEETEEGAQPREPSPEEIAFGTSEGDESEAETEAETDVTDESEATSEGNSGSVDPPGSSTSADPLADPEDE